MSDKQLVVGIADMKICRGPGKLITYALGSCIGICFYDPMIRLGSLPSSLCVPAAGLWLGPGRQAAGGAHGWEPLVYDADGCGETPSQRP